MKIQTPGLIIKETNIGENDKLLVILTKDYGIVRAFADGVRRMKNKNSAATSLLCYSNFTLYQNKDTYKVSDSSPIELFFDLRYHLEELALAQYFCELANEFCEEDYESEEILRLFLNALWLLKSDKKTPGFIKAVTELRLMSLSGYMPALLGCDKCGEYESEVMYFSPENGKIYCEECLPVGQRYCVNASVIQAMRYVSLSDFEKIFSFSLKEDALKKFCELCEGYLLHKTQRKFKTLDFYKTLAL